MKLFDEAIILAVQAHSGQPRKGTKLPYIIHPMEAAAIAATITDDEEILAGAVLHDTVEDGGVTRAELEARFGRRVADLVAAESEDKRQGQDKKATWELRKQEALDGLARASLPEKIIALGDKLSNMRALKRDHDALGEKVWDRFNQKDPAKHAWYYRTMGEIFAAEEGLRDTAACREYCRLVEELFGGL